MKKVGVNCFVIQLCLCTKNYDQVNGGTGKCVCMFAGSVVRHQRFLQRVEIKNVVKANCLGDIFDIAVLLTFILGFIVFLLAKNQEMKTSDKTFTHKIIQAVPMLYLGCFLPKQSRWSKVRQKIPHISIRGKIRDGRTPIGVSEIYINEHN